MFKFKNNIKSHVIFNKTVEQIIDELKSIKSIRKYMILCNLTIFSYCSLITN